MITKVASFNIKEDDLQYVLDVLDINISQGLWCCITKSGEDYKINSYYIEKENK